MCRNLLLGGSREEGLATEVSMTALGIDSLDNLFDSVCYWFASPYHSRPFLLPVHIVR